MFEETVQPELMDCPWGERAQGTKCKKPDCTWPGCAHMCEREGKVNDGD